MRKVSIIMPVRNAMPYLVECLDSILQQSHTNWELIAVNDHSDDESNSMLLKYASLDDRIHCFQNKGRGIIEALKSGYTHSTGQFITRMDADDIMPATKLERLSDLLENSGKGNLSTGKVKYISESELGDGFKKYENWLNRLCEEDSHYSDIYRECVIPSPCWMMYREDFDEIGGFESETYPEDYDLCFRMYQKQIKVIPSSEVLHIWRDHRGRASRNDENYTDNRFIDLKIKYFLSIDFAQNEKLILWGAGKKGKRIAHLLIDHGIDFEWITDNIKKIGKDIYNKKVSDQRVIEKAEKRSIIVAVANKEAQNEIMNKINSLPMRHSVFNFC